MRFVIENENPPPPQSCPGHFQLSQNPPAFISMFFNMLILLFLYFPILDIILQKEWIYSLNTLRSKHRFLKPVFP